MDSVLVSHPGGRGSNPHRGTHNSLWQVVNVTSPHHWNRGASCKLDAKFKFGINFLHFTSEYLIAYFKKFYYRLELSLLLHCSIILLLYLIDVTKHGSLCYIQAISYCQQLNMAFEVKFVVIFFLIHELLRSQVQIRLIEIRLPR